MEKPLRYFFANPVRHTFSPIKRCKGLSPSLGHAAGINFPLLSFYRKKRDVVAVPCGFSREVSLSTTTKKKV